MPQIPTPRIINTINHKLLSTPKILTQLQKTSPNISFLIQQCKTKTHLSQIHAHMAITGLIQYPPLASKLIASFSQNTPHVAHLIADKINGLDTYTWNTIIRGYLERNEHMQAISVYNHVRRIGLKVDSYTLLYVVRACGVLPLICIGLQVHCMIQKLGFVSEMIIQTSLLDFYSVFDDLDSVQQVFDETPDRDLVMWNALITLYAHEIYAEKVIDLARVMVGEGLKLNGVTAVGIFSACSRLNALREGKMVHCYVIKMFLDFDVFVCNSLIDMYSKCGLLSYARGVFRNMPIRNVVSWTSMINGYSDNNYPDNALALFKQMDSENLKFDEIAVLGVISLCSKLGSFEFGEWIGHYVSKKGFDQKNITIANALIDMHAKCGNIRKACQVFDGIAQKTLVSWSSIIQGLAMHGHGLASLLRFSQMERAGFKPDGLVFLSVLSACSHAGLVYEGGKCFDLMITKYQIEPWMEHYGCMVDLLCKAGLVSEAFEFVEKLPIEPNAVVRRILLGACQSKVDIALARKVMKHLCSETSLRESGDYVMLSNLYATIEEWDSVKEVREEMRETGVQKQDPGSSFV